MVGIIFLLVVLVFILLLASFFRLWLQAKLTQADVKFIELIGMWLRKTDYRTIVLSKIAAVQAGLMLSTRELESHYLAGGHIPNVVRALIAAKRANIALDFNEAAAIDLLGRDVLAEVQACASEGAREGPRAEAGIETMDLSPKDSDIGNLRAGPDTC
jgi:uncharacterized protein YqfA (UPF0365 family)